MHVESGLRSFDKNMPEENNRVLTDHLSDVHFCPTRLSANNLLNEGITENIHVFGDVMFDATIRFKNSFKKPAGIPLKILQNNYDLITIHRAEALISKETILNRFEYIKQKSESTSQILLLHPNTEKKISEYKISTSDFFTLPPQGYLETQWLLQNASHVFTDSGGLQKEAFFHEIPTTTIRSSTEWPETLKHGNNKLWIGSTETYASNNEHPFGNGDASIKIANFLKKYLDKANF